MLSKKFLYTSKAVFSHSPVSRQYGLLQFQSRFNSTVRYEYIIQSNPVPNVALIQLNRPKALNALCTPLMNELNEALRAIDQDDNYNAIVLTGSERAFAAGADIKEMRNKTCAECIREDFLASWSDITNIKKPILAAVNGYAVS